MSDPVIRCENLGKSYVLRHDGDRPGYRTLREDLLSLPSRLQAAWRNHGTGEEFWALRKVSFEVRPGEVIGVIGRNGAGKSTLLKILSRITAPTAGGVDLHGRVGSLLEVGTGFHPELTGRENIFLSGAMLGMRRSEVRAHFDAIVAFAEVEQFLDTPCKHYSSGMYTRLGFAVAAHLRTDILLVDEVLAVGDASFQQRCLGKMAEVAGGGRTVLFVSHNLGAIGSLCPRTLWLDHGELHQDGPSREVIERYLADVAGQAGTAATAAAPAGPAWLVSARLAERNGTARQAFSMTEPVRVECEYQVAQAGGYTLSVQVKEFDFSPVVHCTSGDAGFAVPGTTGRHRIAVEVPDMQLYPGRYWLRLALTQTATGRQHDLDRIGFQIEQDFTLCTRPLPRQAGLVYRRAEWTVLSPPSP
jgi:lipopolysaccharide transport system ATP-binding protein